MNTKHLTSMGLPDPAFDQTRSEYYQRVRRFTVGKHETVDCNTCKLSELRGLQLRTVTLRNFDPAVAQHRKLARAARMCVSSSDGKVYVARPLTYEDTGGH